MTPLSLLYRVSQQSSDFLQNKFHQLNSTAITEYASWLPFTSFVQDESIITVKPFTYKSADQRLHFDVYAFTLSWTNFETRSFYRHVPFRWEIYKGVRASFWFSLSKKKNIAKTIKKRYNFYFLEISHQCRENWTICSFNWRSLSQRWFFIKKFRCTHRGSEARDREEQLTWRHSIWWL